MSKSKIRKFFFKYLELAKTGRKICVPLWRIVKAILNILKTDIQWKYLPMWQFFAFAKYSWALVYSHFNKWSQTGIWEKCHRKSIADHRSQLDMSLENLVGNYIPAKRGGEATGYLGR